jgi:hypothetical protein
VNRFQIYAEFVGICDENPNDPANQIQNGADLGVLEPTHFGPLPGCVDGCSQSAVQKIPMCVRNGAENPNEGSDTLPSG